MSDPRSAFSEMEETMFLQRSYHLVSVISSNRVVLCGRGDVFYPAPAARLSCRAGPGRSRGMSRGGWNGSHQAWGGIFGDCRSRLAQLGDALAFLFKPDVAGWPLHLVHFLQEIVFVLFRLSLGSFFWLLQRLPHQRRPLLGPNLVKQIVMLFIKSKISLHSFVCQPFLQT